MPSSTSTIAARRVSLRDALRAHEHGPIIARRAGAGGSSSPAGLQRRPWLARLRRALEQELFTLHFQPIVSLRDGRVRHFEALLRLADEADGSLVAPGSFLPAAERYGLIRDIDRMVIDRAAALLADGATGEHGALAVNVSAVSVTELGLLAHLQRTIERRRIDPARLIVEVTETAAISDMRRAREFCAGVQGLGCAIALDDFGAGFGSFQYLKHLPFSYLKIDGEFVRGLPCSRTDQLVVSALAGVVAGMGRRTIAEFVGDRPTLQMLRDFGVDYAQGFAVGRPQPTLPAAR